MSWSKMCPVCRSVKIFRKTVRTCGAPDCMTEWSAMSSSSRALAVEKANEPAMTEEEFQEWTKNRPTITSEEVEAKPQAGPGPALEYIFGNAEGSAEGSQDAPTKDGTSASTLTEQEQRDLRMKQQKEFFTS